MESVAHQIGRLNVERYRRLLAVEKDDSKRRTIAALLEEELAKLMKIAENKSDG